MFGEPALVDRVLELGAPLEHKDTAGDTPLIAAAMLGYPQAVNKLIERGADLEARNNDGQTALVVSVLSLSVNQTDMNSPSYSKLHNRWETVIKTLVEHGADVNAVDKQGASALFFAIFSGDVALCNYLIQAGADVRHQLPTGISLLRYAKAESKTSIVRLLEQQLASLP
jgi:ankyrin repeat protein